MKHLFILAAMATAFTNCTGQKIEYRTTFQEVREGDNWFCKMDTGTVTLSVRREVFDFCGPHSTAAYFLKGIQTNSEGDIVAMVADGGTEEVVIYDPATKTITHWEGEKSTTYHREPTAPQIVNETPNAKARFAKQN
jgi:hypothetical protein